MKISTLNRERVNALIEITSERFGVNVLAKSRRRPVIYARAACFMAMRTYLNLTYKQIGFFFDKFNFTAVHIKLQIKAVDGIICQEYLARM